MKFQKFRGNSNSPFKFPIQVEIPPGLSFFIHFPFLIHFFFIHLI